MRITFLILCLCLIGLAVTQIEGADLDDWDGETSEAPAIINPTLVEEAPQAPSSKLSLFLAQFKRSSAGKLKVEIGLLVFIAAYIINLLIGRSANNDIANMWAQTFCTSDGVFDKNFTMVGAGKVPLTKESASQFRLYCSGRRFCKSLGATLKLKRRQDLFSCLLALIWPEEDQLDIEVYMKEGSMPLTVIAVATKKVMRAMLREDGGEDDVRKLTRKLEVKIPGWPADKLLVYGEHSSIFQDLISEQLLEGIFRRPAFDTQSKYFRMLHITPEQTYGPKDQKSVIRFSFALPKRANMADLTRLLSSVGVFIDIVGNFKLSGELQKRAEKLRQDAEKKDDPDKAKELEDVAEERRNKKRLEEAERLRRMTPEQREKYKAKRDKIEQGRMQRRFSKRM